MYADARIGVPLLAAHLLAIFASAALLMTWIGVGATLRRRIAPESTFGAGTQLVVDAALGGHALAMLFFALGVAGMLRPLVVIAATLLALLMVRVEAGLAITRLWRGARALPRDRRLVPIVGLAGAGMLLMAGAVGPATDWDSLMYHLRIPSWFLAEGRIATPPDSFHVALIGAAHFATLPLLAAGVHAGPAVMNVLLLGLVMAGTYELARAALVSPAARWLAVAALFGCPVIALGAITARVDATLLLPLLATHLVLLSAAETRAQREVILAAVLMGAALAMKPVAAAYGLMLVPLGFRATRGWRPAAMAVGVAALLAAPWVVKTIWLAGAPLYPRGAPGWFEPWLAEIFGGRIPPAGFDKSILSALRESRAPFNVMDAFFSPGRLAIEGEGRFYAFSPLLLLVPLAVLSWRSRRLAVELAVIGVALIVLVIVPFQGANLRYLIPALPPLAVAAAAASDALARRLPPTLRGWAFAAFGLIAIIPLAPALSSRFGGHAVLLQHAIGTATARDVWVWHPDPVVRSYAPAIAAVHAQVPRNGRVLMLWEARVFPLERDALADVRLSNWSYLAQSPVVDDCLRGTGITHVLVNTGALEFYTGRGARRDAFRLDQFERFRSRCVAEQAELETGFELMTLATASPGAVAPSAAGATRRPPAGAGSPR
jgi:hypothetical protein